ncbi:acyl-CoA thioesterase [Oceanisphaera psychrotolerans]|uniref:Acyl-CoA thioesterase n=1 Tax=Oceanisphaera psychrotolerans TaxID=1414654 RepID=A0A1J4QCY7_9GAMM|nr:acyl-CoA thioesterase [Oceanisphaera psychrotolerans]OIN09201.1 acyl-CoA thioesterase [Oceanisphaera psychrotolerans]
MSEAVFRTVKSSQVILKELMVPSYANFGGKVHGGIILSLMDKIAYTCAATHAKGYCVTASVDSVDFVNPVEVGDLLTLYASVNYVGKSSMEVGIKVVSEDFKQGIVKHTNTSYFTMVALDEQTRKPCQVAGLQLEDEEEIRRFVMGKLRKQLRRTHQQEITDIRKSLELGQAISQLEGENCLLPKG